MNIITCKNCHIPLYTERDIFGPPQYPLCLDCHSAFIEDNGIDFYRNRAQVVKLQHDFSADCPHCHYPMEVGVADETVNTKCPICGYEETHNLDNSLLDTDDDWSWRQGK